MTEPVTEPKLSIDRGVPIPERYSTRGGPMSKLGKIGLWRMPFAELEVGDSFLIPPIEGMKARDLQPTVRRTALRAGIKIEMRMTDEGYRVWRVE